MRLRLDIAYDGSEFHGWARQRGLRTVQEELEAHLEGEDIEIAVNSRYISDVIKNTSAAAISPSHGLPVR